MLVALQSQSVTIFWAICHDSCTKQNALADNNNVSSSILIGTKKQPRLSTPHSIYCPSTLCPTLYLRLPNFDSSSSATFNFAFTTNRPAMTYRWLHDKSCTCRQWSSSSSSSARAWLAAVNNPELKEVCLQHYFCSHQDAFANAALDSMGLLSSFLSHLPVRLSDVTFFLSSHHFMSWWQLGWVSCALSRTQTGYLYYQLIETHHVN